MAKTTTVKKGEVVNIEKGAVLVIASQSFTVADVQVMGPDGFPKTIKCLVPAKEV